MNKLLIAVLEDNTDRREAMEGWLTERFSMYERFFTDDPYAMINAIKMRRSDLMVLSLDHDLHERPDFSTELTGMIVAKHLASETRIGRSLPITAGFLPSNMGHQPSSTRDARSFEKFPIILHTTNTRDGDTMEVMLRESRWPVQRVIPFDGVTWVHQDWHRALKRAMQSNMRTVAADDLPD